MKIGAQQGLNSNKYVRLSKDDITRMPSLNKNRIDFYQGTNAVVQKPQSNYWKKIFTVLTFGLVGLYLAHRNNLFNPIKRETKRIINDQNLKEQVISLVKKQVTPETYQSSTKRFLQNIINDKSRAADFGNEAQKILGDNASFQELMTKVTKRLNDDTPEGLQEGFCVDILDRLFGKIEKYLTNAKREGLPYKNQNAGIIEKIFAKPQNAESIAEETLYEAISNRSASTIETFINDSIIKTKLAAN